MKIHEKAKLYDELLKDFESLIEDVRKFKTELEELPNREDIQPMKESNQGHYYAMCTGAFSAMPMALDMKMWKHEWNLKYYKNQK
jgi:hypothetical protein